MIRNPLPTQHYLLSRLHYDPGTGSFFWKTQDGNDWRTRRRNTMFAGKEAGSVDNKGYRSIRWGNSLIGAHRLAWIYVNGEIPIGFIIDHINGDPSDNRIANLRIATRSENSMNKKCPTLSSTGLKGVHPQRGRWQARIMREGRSVHIGMFATKEEAHSAYLSAAEGMHGEFAFHTSREAA